MSTDLFIRRPVMTTLLMAGDPGLRHHGVPAPAGQRPAERRLPDHPGHREPARRQPGDHGLGGGHAAREAVLHHRGHRLDDLDERARARRRSRSSSRSSGTSTPRRRTCRRPSPPRSPRCRPACRRRPRTRRSIRPTSRSCTSRSARRPCRSTWWTSTRRPSSRSASRRSAAWRRCSIFGSQKYAVRVQLDPERAGHARHRHRRGAEGARRRQRQPAHRHALGAEPGLHRAGHRPAHQRRGVPPAHRGLPQRRAGAARAARPRDRQRAERQGRLLVQRRARGRARRSRSSPAPTPSRWWTRSTGCCPRSAPQLPAVGEPRTSSTTARSRSAPRCTTWSSRCCSPSRWWCW